MDAARKAKELTTMVSCWALVAKPQAIRACEKHGVPDFSFLTGSNCTLFPSLLVHYHDSMHCFRCEREAVDRCFTCGALFCDDHGHLNCERCDTAIAPGDRRTDRITSRPLSTEQRKGWWRPQQAEEFSPPACYQCHGLARRVCRHCESYYCSEHAGPNGLCARCLRSSSLGLVILIGTLALLGVLILFGY